MSEIRERFDFQAQNQSASSALEYAERIAALRSAVGGMLDTGIANGDC
jgi:hypothetical protein